MGPKAKVAAKEKDVVEEEVKVEIVADFLYSISVTVNDALKVPEKISFKFISEWCKCSSTPLRYLLFGNLIQLHFCTVGIFNARTWI